MPQPSEATTRYFSWKEQFVNKLAENKVGRHGFQNSFYSNLLLKNFEKVYADQLSIIYVNEQFISLIQQYSNDLKVAYGLKWEQATRTASSHPVFLEFIDELQKKSVLFKKEIKMLAPILVQESRASPDGFFKNLPTDYLYELANYLEPQLSFQDATQTMKDERQKADDFYEAMQVFSYEEDNILFSTNDGTHVILSAQNFFKNWFSALPLKENSPLNGKYGFYKVNENALAINSGPSTPGIQILKKGDAFIVRNNLTADNPNCDMTTEQLTLARRNSLVHILTELNIALRSEPNNDHANVANVPVEICSLQ